MMRYDLYNDIFCLWKLTEMPTMHGQHHQFSTTEKFFLKHSELSEVENLTLVGLKPTTFQLHTECSNHI